MDQMVNYIWLAWKLAYILRTYGTYNSTVEFSKYEFNNKLLDNATLLRITQSVTLSLYLYLYIYIYILLDVALLSILYSWILLLCVVTFLAIIKPIYLYLLQSLYLPLISEVRLVFGIRELGFRHCEAYWWF